MKAINLKPFNLEDRTFKFAQRCKNFTLNVQKTTANHEYNIQLIRSSGSTAANYIEANEALSKKDFVHRIKICRKEAKESSLWLNLIDTGDNEKLKNEKHNLIQESTELIKIFTSIIVKSE